MAPCLLVYSLDAKLQSADGGKYQACSLHNCNLRRINSTFYRNGSERSPEAHKAAKIAAGEAEMWQSADFSHMTTCPLACLQ